MATLWCHNPVAVLGLGRGTLQFCSAPPSFVATYDFFPNIAQISDYFVFANFKKIGKFIASIGRPKTKSALASVGLCPLTPDQGQPARDSAPRPHYRLVLPHSPWGCAPQILRAGATAAIKTVTICNGLPQFATKATACMCSLFCYPKSRDL